ncbi:hypothetical protein D9M71_793850 [compost metagenome]
MLLGGEIDDPAWAIKLPDLGNEHLSSLDLLGFAGRGIQAKVLSKALFEHERDTFAHHPDGVDRVNQCFDLRLKQIALRVPNHQKYQPVRV